MKTNKEDFFKPVLPRRNSEYVAHQIEEAIIQKVYIPDEKLPSERELALQFNVGRGAIREAVRILDASGYVEVKHGGDGGIYVKELDSTRISKSVNDLVRIGNISLPDITEMRVLIETAVIESVFESLGAKEVSKLEDNINICESLIKNNESVFGEIQNFHIILSSFCQNRLFYHILVSLSDIIDSYISSIKDPVSHLEQHQMILSAIKKGDLDKSKELIVSHLGRVSKILEEQIQSKSKTN